MRESLVIDKVGREELRNDLAKNAARLTYLFEGCLEAYALGVDDFLGELGLRDGGSVELDARVDDSVGRLKHLEVLDGADAPVEVHNPGDQLGVGCQEGREVSDSWSCLLLRTSSQLGELIGWGGEETAKVVLAGGGLQGEAHNVVAALAERLHRWWLLSLWCRESRKS